LSTHLPGAGRRRRDAEGGRRRRKRGCRIKWARNPREDRRDAAPYRSNSRQPALYPRARERVDDDNAITISERASRDALSLSLSLCLCFAILSMRVFPTAGIRIPRSGIKAAPVGVPLFRETPMKTSTAAGDFRGLQQRRRAEPTPLLHATMTGNETLRQRPPRRLSFARARAGEKKRDRNLASGLASRSHVSIVTFPLSAIIIRAADRRAGKMAESVPRRSFRREFSRDARPGLAPARIIPCN